MGLDGTLGKLGNIDESDIRIIKDKFDNEIWKQVIFSKAYRETGKDTKILAMKMKDMLFQVYVMGVSHGKNVGKFQG